MSSRVFEIFREGASITQLAQTCTEIEGHVLRTYLYGTDLQFIIRNFEDVTMEVLYENISGTNPDRNAMEVTESKIYI